MRSSDSRVAVKTNKTADRKKAVPNTGVVVAKPGKVRAEKSDYVLRGISYTVVTIFTIILIAALLMYDRSTGVFKRGVEAADAQQNTRVAFDRMVADLRMAGFDYDRDGFPSGAAGTTWAAGRAYGLNNIVVPTTANGFNYRATTAGTSHATDEPAWPTTIGDTVNDNGIVWETLAGSSQAQQPDEQIEYIPPTFGHSHDLHKAHEDEGTGDNPDPAAVGERGAASAFLMFVDQRHGHSAAR